MGIGAYELLLCIRRRKRAWGPRPRSPRSDAGSVVPRNSPPPKSATPALANAWLANAPAHPDSTESGDL